MLAISPYNNTKISQWLVNYSIYFAVSVLFSHGFLQLWRHHLSSNIRKLEKSMEIVDQQFTVLRKKSQVLLTDFPKAAKLPDLNTFFLKQLWLLAALKNIPVALPSESYLTTLLFNQKGIILEGILLQTAQEPFKNFIFNSPITKNSTVIFLKQDVLAWQKLGFKILIAKK